MTEINIFLFSFFPQTGVTRSGNSEQQKALHLYSRGLGGREGSLMAEIYLFCFPIFSPNMSGISGLHIPFTFYRRPGNSPLIMTVFHWFITPYSPIKAILSGQVVELSHECVYPMAALNGYLLYISIEIV